MSTIIGLMAAALVLMAVFGACLVFLISKLKGSDKKKLRSVTRILFITTQVAALVWVSMSYLIALYATVRLGQPFPVVELSEQAITTILGVNVLKVVENIFEHNDGPVFGTCQKKQQDTD